MAVLNTAQSGQGMHDVLMQLARCCKSTWTKIQCCFGASCVALLVANVSHTHLGVYSACVLRCGQVAVVHPSESAYGFVREHISDDRSTPTACAACVGHARHHLPVRIGRPSHCMRLDADNWCDAGLPTLSSCLGLCLTPHSTPFEMAGISSCLSAAWRCVVSTCMVSCSEATRRLSLCACMGVWVVCRERRCNPW